MSRAERPRRSDSGSEWSSASRRERDAGAQAEEEVLRIGCSMLSRIRMRPRNPGAMSLMRCSLGYALQTDDDVARCLAVEGPSTCWKAAAPSWRVPALPEEPVQHGTAGGNGRQRPEASGSTRVEHGEMQPPAGDEVIEIELTSVVIIVDDA